MIPDGLEGLVGIGAGAALAIIGKVIGVILNAVTTLSDLGAKREAERYGRSKGALKAVDASADRAAERADDSDPGSVIRRFIIFMFVFYAIVALLIAGFTGSTMAFEREIEVPSSWFGIVEGHTAVVWDTIRNAVAFPLFVIKTVLTIVGAYFGFGMMSKIMRRY